MQLSNAETKRRNNMTENKSNAIAAGVCTATAAAVISGFIFIPKVTLSLFGIAIVYLIFYILVSR